MWGQTVSNDAPEQDNHLGLIRDISMAIIPVDFVRLKQSFEWLVDSKGIKNADELRHIINAAELFQIAVAEAEFRFAKEEGKIN